MLEKSSYGSNLMFFNSSSGLLDKILHDLSGGCRGLSLCGLACELNHSHFRAVFK